VPFALAAPLRRGLIVATVVVTFVALVGATYQGVATALERRRFPHNGRLVDVGDHQLHIDCTGDGFPIVVLEAPATGMSAAWGWVQPELARTTRVCSYDRAGLGWSEAGDRPYDPQRVAEELHVLLANAHERGPYVMVGQGLGAAFARLFASRYGPDTAALILIDTPAGGGGSARSAMRLARVAPWLARVGMARATDLFARAATDLPGDAGERMRLFLNRPDHLTRSAQELAKAPAAVSLAATATVAPALSIESITVAGGRPSAYLTDAAARQVTEAIRKTVIQARSAGRSRHN
jgi:pimeloyl-ACP methyl ester carboxylesterase